MSTVDCVVVITLPLPTAQNIYNSEDQTTDSQKNSSAGKLVIQFIPSGLVITLSPEPVAETAQNIPSSGDHVIDRHGISAALTYVVHVIPSELVITRSPKLGPDDTAQKIANWGDHVIDCQLSLLVV